MNQPAPPNEEPAHDDETLVAYLDGQLSADECERIEARLATDESTRLRVSEFDLVWDALDSLPRTTASASFTQTTVDMAALHQGGPAAPTPWPRVPWSRLAVGIGGLACGAFIALVLSGTGDRRAVRSLPTALHAGALENASSTEFLTGLVDLWGEGFDSHLEGEAREAAREWAELASADAAQRRAWIAALPPERVEHVSGRVEAFRNTSSARRDALLRLDREIAQHPSRDELRAAALTYNTLIATLTPGQRAQLRGLSVENRLAETRRKGKAWLVRAVLQLDDAERDALLVAIDQLAQDKGFAAALAGAPGTWSARQFFWGVTRVVASDRVPPASVQPPRAGEATARERLLRGLQRVVASWPEWAARLEPALPEGIREQLAKAKSDRNRATLWDRLLRGLRSGELSDAFADLPNDRLEQVLLLPSEELTETLDTPPEPRRRRDRPGGPRFDQRRFGPPPPRGER